MADPPRSAGTRSSSTRTCPARGSTAGRTASGSSAAGSGRSSSTPGWPPPGGARGSRSTSTGRPAPRIRWTPPAHLARRRAGVQDAVVEALFTAYFTAASDLSDRATLSAIAVGAGLDRAEVDELLAGETGLDAVRAGEERGAATRGVRRAVLRHQREGRPVRAQPPEVPRRHQAGGADQPRPTRGTADPGKTEYLERRFKALFPAADFEVAYAWAGTFGETEDGLAYIGKPPERPDDYFAAGLRRQRDHDERHRRSADRRRLPGAREPRRPHLSASAADHSSRATRLQGRFGGARQHLAGRLEPGAVARAVPRRSGRRSSFTRQPRCVQDGDSVTRLPFGSR